MRKIGFVVFWTVVFFLIEFVFFNYAHIGAYFPNLILIFIIFLDLSFGVRYAILAAVLGGILKDSFGLNFVGMHIFAFLAAAYFTIFFKKYIYSVGSRFSRLFLAFLVCLCYLFLQYCLRVIHHPVDFLRAFQSIIIPNLISTSICSIFIINWFKSCASRLYD